MSQNKAPTKAGATELKEEDLDKIQGGVVGRNVLNFKVAIEGVTQGAFKDSQDK